MLSFIYDNKQYIVHKYVIYHIYMIRNNKTWQKNRKIPQNQPTNQPANQATNQWKNPSKASNTFDMLFCFSG